MMVCGYLGLNEGNHHPGGSFYGRVYGRVYGVYMGALNMLGLGHVKQDILVFLEAEKPGEAWVSVHD